MADIFISYMMYRMISDLQNHFLDEDDRIRL